MGGFHLSSPLDTTSSKTSLKTNNLATVAQARLSVVIASGPRKLIRLHRLLRLVIGGHAWALGADRLVKRAPVMFPGLNPFRHAAPRQYVSNLDMAHVMTSMIQVAMDIPNPRAIERRASSNGRDLLQASRKQQAAQADAYRYPRSLHHTVESLGRSPTLNTRHPHGE